jgi:hypothetical protein
VIDELRLAASVIAGRDAPGGLELLVIERSRTSRFLPGYVASRVARPAKRYDLARSGSDADGVACLPMGAGRETALALAPTTRSDGGGIAQPRRHGAALDLPLPRWRTGSARVPVRFDARYTGWSIDGLEPTPDGTRRRGRWSNAADLSRRDASRRKVTGRPTSRWSTWPVSLGGRHSPAVRDQEPRRRSGAPDHLPAGLTCSRCVRVLAPSVYVGGMPGWDEIRSGDDPGRHRTWTMSSAAGRVQWSS